MKLMKMALLGLILMASPALADSLPTRSKIGTPYEPTPVDYKMHNFELGVGVGYGWTGAEYDFSAQDVNWNLTVGYLMRPNDFVGFGLDFDALRTHDEWLFDLRGRAGVFVLPGLFLYGTGGAAYNEHVDWGWVAGTGVELSLSKNLVTRLEYLHYDFSDYGATHDTVMATLAFKF